MTKMTVKDIAETLNVNKATVTRAVEKLDAVLHPVEKNKQGGYLFTEEQAVTIKKEIEKHHNLKSRQIETVTSDYEENQVILNAINILSKRLEVAQPKLQYADAVMASEKLLSIHDTAKELNQPGFGEYNLYKFLRNEAILMSNNIPYQQYIEQGYFKVITKPFTKPNGKREISHQTYTTPKGRVWILKKIKEGLNGGNSIASNKASRQLAVSF